MSFNTTILPSLDFEEAICDSVTTDQKIFSGNKLITNASLLLNLVLKLRHKLAPRDAVELKKKLIQEIKLFEDLISNYDYSAETIAKARYGLCAFIDDLLMNTLWGMEVNWEHNGLLYAFEKETSSISGKRFFSILKEAGEDPVKNIDIIELYYIFLTLGFGGKYRGIVKGKNALSKFTNDLYECISRYRVHFDNTLFQEDIPVIKEKLKEKMEYKYIAMSGLIGIAVFCFFYFYLNSDLNRALDPLISDITSTITAL